MNEPGKRPRNARPTAGVDQDGRHNDQRVEVKIGSGGRIVIPAAFREAMEAREGDTLVAVIDGDGVVQLASASAALRMARRIVSEAIPGDVSLSASLIEDRCRETGR